MALKPKSVWNTLTFHNITQRNPSNNLDHKIDLKLDAAPAGPTVYRVGGTLAYTEGTTRVTIPLAEVPITFDWFAKRKGMALTREERGRRLAEQIDADAKERRRREANDRVLRECRGELPYPTF